MITFDRISEYYGCDDYVLIARELCMLSSSLVISIGEDVYVCIKLRREGVFPPRLPEV